MSERIELAIREHRWEITDCGNWGNETIRVSWWKPELITELPKMRSRINVGYSRLFVCLYNRASLSFFETCCCQIDVRRYLWMPQYSKDNHIVEYVAWGNVCLKRSVTGPKRSWGLVFYAFMNAIELDLHCNISKYGASKYMRMLSVSWMSGVSGVHYINDQIFTYRWPSWSPWCIRNLWPVGKIPVMCIGTVRVLISSTRGKRATREFH